MANPNIVSVSSIYGQSIGETLSTTVTTDIMTCQSNKILKINRIRVVFNLVLISEIIINFNFLKQN